MAKRAGDIILRDRLQFTMDASGDRTTVYGRLDLSQYTTGKNGLAIKEIKFMLRDPASSTLPNTGNWTFTGDNNATDSDYLSRTAYKLFATTRAYENASDVGIASPDVLCVQTGEWVVGTFGANSGDAGRCVWFNEEWYGPDDLHPEGYTIVTDLLIGIALDTWIMDANQTMELDVLLVADKITVSTTQMNALLSQAQDI
jgi:hypothetical protein